MHTNPIQNHIWAASITKICMKKPRQNRGSRGVGQPRRVGGTDSNVFTFTSLLEKQITRRVLINLLPSLMIDWGVRIFFIAIH